jgi:hypothetical protein
MSHPQTYPKVDGQVQKCTLVIHSIGQKKENFKGNSKNK